MINTGEPIKKQPWQETASRRPSPEPVRIHRERSFISTSLPVPPGDFPSPRQRPVSIGGTKIRSASTLIIFNRALLGRAGTEGRRRPRV